jgi:hypothetical protein
MEDPGDGGPWGWRTLGMAAPGDGGPWGWQTLGMAAPGDGGPEPGHWLLIIKGLHGISVSISSTFTYSL